MKKLYGYLLIAAGFLTIVSCDKDSDYEAPVSSINVVSAETYLSAAGETKSIVLDNTPASVYAQDAWLTVTNEGNKVNLTAEANTSIQSRNTEVVVKSTAGDSIMVTVSQGGSVFELKDKSDLFSPDTEVTKTYSVMSNLPITCTPTVDWLTVTNTSNSFTVSATANTTGKPRVGYVKVASGSFVDSIKVLQVKASDLITRYLPYPIYLPFVTYCIGKKSETTSQECQSKSSNLFLVRKIARILKLCILLIIRFLRIFK